MQRWGTEELAEYFPPLFLNDRPDRQGFPYEILKERFFLQALHEEAKRKALE